jgi:hypothetical protein
MVCARGMVFMIQQFLLHSLTPPLSTLSPVCDVLFDIFCYKKLSLYISLLYIFDYDYWKDELDVDEKGRKLYTSFHFNNGVTGKSIDCKREASLRMPEKRKTRRTRRSK